MGHYLPLLLRRYLLNKEREHGLRILTRNQIVTTKQAKELLIDCLHAIFMKMNNGKNAINHIIEINNANRNSESGAADTGIQYFFGSMPTSLDACLVAQIALLECAQLPCKYLSAEIKSDAKIKFLLRYAKRIMQHYQPSIVAKLTADNEIEPVPILMKPKDFTTKSQPAAAKKKEQSYFYSKYVDTEEKRSSMMFVVASVTAFAVYWKVFQPLRQ